MLHSISGFVIDMWRSVIGLCVPKCLESAALSPKHRLIVILWYWLDQNTGVFPTAVLPLHHSTLLGLFRDPSPATWCQPSTFFHYFFCSTSPQLFSLTFPCMLLSLALNTRDSSGFFWTTTSLYPS